MLVDIYFGLFKVKEVHAIKKSMTKLFEILLDRIAPPSVTFTLTEHEEEDKVTLVLMESQTNLVLEHQETVSQIMTPAQPNLEAASDMKTTLERIEMFSTSSNLKIPRVVEREMDEAPVNQIRADTAVSVASSVTASAKKAPSTTSSANAPQGKGKESGTEIPNPVTPIVRKNVVNKNTDIVTKVSAPYKEMGTPVVMSQESTQVTKADNMFNLGTMPASDDTELQNLDTSTVGLNRTVIDLTGTTSKIHGNEQGIKGIPEKGVMATSIEVNDNAQKTATDDFVPITRNQSQQHHGKNERWE